MNSPKSKTPYLGALLLGVVTALAVAALLVSIASKKEEGKHRLPQLASLSDEDVRLEKWGQGFQAQLAQHLSMKDNTAMTRFGGSLPYSRIIRYPQLTRLWAGYAFAKDFNEERSHYFSQLDQVETKRNNQEWLNAHGAPNFKGQPGACMNCHSGWTPTLIRELGWEGFNKTPYTELKKMLVEKHGEGMHAAQLGSTCADCHSPKDMSLRVTRPAYINAMVERGYTASEKQGIVASPSEMRNHVCQQCHVEYYFKGPSKLLTFPWTEWPKDEPLRIEQVESHYDAMRSGRVFEKDWKHKETGASMLKAQHPETELYSSGLHAQSGVTCADCHMPYVREGAIKVTHHNIASPKTRIRQACQTCHQIDANKLVARIDQIQGRTASALRDAEKALLALMDDIVKAKKLIAKKGMASQEESLLAEALEAHRVASFRWDFIASENSTGFHSPQEAMRVLNLSLNASRNGQLALVQAFAKAGEVFSPTVGSGFIPEKGEPIEDRDSLDVGNPPPEGLDSEKLF